MRGLTLKQLTVLRFIHAFSKERGYPPTRKEIAEAAGFGPNAATCHVNRLKNKGYVTVTPKVSRGIRICELLFPP